MTTKRGGRRNLGMILSNNTSTLNGIRFGYAGRSRVAQVYVAYNDEFGHARRTQFSVEANGRRGALQLAIDRRQSAEMPAPSISAALRALARFLGS